MSEFWIVAYPGGAEWGSVSNPRQRLAWADCLSQWQEGSGGSEPSGEALADASGSRLEGTGNVQGSSSGTRTRQWFIEPDVGRVAHGVPARVERLRALGNAVVPQIPEIIGRAIMSELSMRRDRD